MLRRLFYTLLLLMFAASARAQVGAEEHPIYLNYDLDTPTITATTNYIVAQVNLTNTALAIAHQPDTPRNLTITIVDSTPSINTGTVVIVGTDVNDTAQTWTADVSSGAGVYTGTLIFKTVTSVTPTAVGVLGGAGDETIKVGVGSTAAYVFCNVAPTRNGIGPISTVGSSATVSATDGTSAVFGGVGVGDEIYVNGTTRYVVTASSATSVVLDAAINLSANALGYPFTYRHISCGYSNSDGWVLVAHGHSDMPASVGLSVDQASDTGGVDWILEGKYRDALLMQPTIFASGNLSSACIVGAPASTCNVVMPIADRSMMIRLGLRFGTTDDAVDTGTLKEKINAVLTQVISQ